MSKGNIFVVDDEEDILELIRMNLEREGYKVTCIDAGEECVKKAREKIPDLVLLDLMLPGIDGLDVCKILKNDSKTRHIPIVMLTAKGEESDIVTGLELGADDYITKPFNLKVLIARIKAVLRKGSVSQESGSAEVIKRKNLVIDPGRREVTAGGKKIDLTFTEFEILAFLARRPGWVFTRNQIVNGVKGGGYPVTERAVDVQIVGIRKKLGAAAEMIDTIRGVGYRFND
ncbi:MAG TPA: DNA-binding response regulator [Lentisphaeria bacterium]|nr:MAG: DNA-binding response regulator [Lentisphaerae bacterium GWF2_50_93]HCE44328.1 DNA-binding response regulator [Lentisphaeria bacterium]